MNGDAWLYEHWLPASSVPVAVLEESRPAHLEALAVYQTARRATARIGGADEAERREARDREAQAMLALCDVVEALYDRLLDRQGELTAFVARGRRRVDPADARAVDRLLLSLRTDSILGNLATARYEARTILAGREVTAW